MKSTHTTAFGRTVGVAAIGIFLLSACTTEDAAELSDDEPATASPAEPEPATNDAQEDTYQQDVLIAEVDDPVEFAECLEAEAIDGATVEWLEDVVIEEQEIPGTETEILEVDGQEIELPGVPSVVIPERTGQGGCIIEYPAPGGCLPAIEISGSYIPGYEIPERALPEVELPDGTVLEEQTQPSLRGDAVDQPGASEDEVCQIEPDDAQEDDMVNGVLRSGILRSGISQSGASNAGHIRPSVNTDSGDRVASQRVPSYQVPSMSVPYARIPSDRLASYRVEGADHTEYSEKDETIAYTTEGDVLFDSDDHELRSDAESELQAIADDIAQRDDDYTIMVEGHTDNLPTEVYDDNEELSEQRAESVVTWLQEHADVVDGDLTAEGMGEDYPRADNDTDEGRQQNRRVVITVTPVDYEPEIDYEADDSE